MSQKKLLDRLHLFNRALKSLIEAIELPIENQRDQAGVIQNFEFTYELSWKTLKAQLEHLGIQPPTSPRGVFKEAFAQKLIADEDVWLNMISDRNLTTHTYDEEIALRIIGKIKSSYIAVFNELQKKLAKDTGLE